MKKALSIILAILMIMATVPFAFAAETNVITDEASLKTAFETGGEYTLGNDIDITDSVYHDNDVTTVIDMNGYTIGNEVWDFMVQAGDLTLYGGSINNVVPSVHEGSLTLKDISVTGLAAALVGSHGGTLTLENVTMSGDHSACIHVSGGQTKIIGGTYTCGTFDGADEIILYFDEIPDVKIYGGTFSKSVAEYVADGYIETEVDGKYIVAECSHDWDYDNGVLTRPVLDSGNYIKGYYTYTCTICGGTYTEDVEGADLSAYNDVYGKVHGYLEYATLTNEAKEEIFYNYYIVTINNREGFDSLGYARSDFIASEQAIVDKATAELQKIVDEVERKIASGEYVKADYTEIDEAIKAVDTALENATISDEMANELADIKADLEALKENENGTMADVNELIERAEAITEKMNNCANGVHEFGEYTSNSDATCTADGTKTAECVNGCGKTDTVTDEGTKLTHADEDGDKLCDNCGDNLAACEYCSRVHETVIDEFICILVRFFKLVASFITFTR